MDGGVHLITHEQELSAREIFLKHVLNNCLLWIIAIASILIALTWNSGKRALGAG